MGSRLYCMRWLVIQANLILMVCGLVLLALGIWTMNDKSFLEELLRNRLYMDTTYIILISSTAMIFLSCFGCFAAMKEIKCFLLTYNVLMLLLLVVLMVGGTLAYIFREQVEWTMKAEMMADLRNYIPADSSDSVLLSSSSLSPPSPHIVITTTTIATITTIMSSQVTRSWDEAQSQLQCCGFLTEQVEAPWQMWRYNKALNPMPPDSREGTVLPGSCCSEDHQGECQGGTSDVYTGDCLALSLKYVQEHAATLGAAAIAVTCLMTLGMASSMALFKTIV